MLFGAAAGKRLLPLLSLLCGIDLQVARLDNLQYPKRIQRVSTLVSSTTKPKVARSNPAGCTGLATIHLFRQT
jgi:hypothetical protein